MARRVGQAGGGFQVQGVHEGLREVAAELVLVDVELLGVQLGWSRAGPGPFVPAGRLHGPVLLLQGEGDEEPAQGEGPFGVGQRPVVVPEPVGVPVAGEVGQVPGEGGGGARVVGGDRRRAAAAAAARRPAPGPAGSVATARWDAPRWLRCRR